MNGFADLYRWRRRAIDKAGSLLLARSFASWGQHSVIQSPIRLAGEANIAIGSDVFIGANSWTQVIACPSADDIVISIGSGTRISGACVLSAARNISIGNDVLIARNGYVADHSHAYADPEMPIRRQGIANVRPVAVGDGAWLGQNVVINPGVQIGRNSVIGANSVVTSSIPDCALAVGAPARVVRQWGDRG